MEDIFFSVPEIKFNEDFTIIYKGKDENASNKEKIIEIKTSREELTRRLHYFKDKSNELKYTNEYYIHDEFSTKTFNDFILSLKTKKIAINEQNYLEYSKLSSKYEYNEIQEIVDQFIQNRPDLQIILEKISQNLADDDIEKEKMIAKNLDFCLEHGNLFKLPISTLIRIFNSPERNLKNNHLLFSFIKEKINQNQMNKTDKLEDIEILISSLDLNEMSTDEIDQYLNFQGINETFIPKNTKKLMKTIFDSNKELEKRIEKLENALLNETNKRNEERNEYLENINKLKETGEKLENALLNETNKRNEERNEYLENIRKLKETEEKLENALLNETNKRNEEQKLKPVTLIEIEPETISLSPDKIITLNAIVKPKDATNRNVEWTINEEVTKTVEIISQTSETLAFKILKFGQKVTIDIGAVDGSGIHSMKVIDLGILQGEITATVDQYQIIKGKINIKENLTKLDNAKSKYVLVENNSSNLGENGYNSGSPIESLSQNFSFTKSSGNIYYLHALIVDNFNNSFELVSRPLIVGSLTFNYTGKQQSVDLDAGKYKLEVWGAEGGSSYCNIQRLGGKGGYSVGTIEFQNKTKLYIYVGGQGVGQELQEKVEGGFNGGGYNADTESGYKKGVGGGGTDIRIQNDSLYSRVIVAGGGGGGNGSSCGCPSKGAINGGVGGGISGGVGIKTLEGTKCSHKWLECNALPGTQISGGKPGNCNEYSEHLNSSGIVIATGVFGCGGSVTKEIQNTRAGAGGGGWYGGGAGNGHGGSGSGGSGWVFTETNYNEWKRGNPNDADKYELDRKYYLKDAETIPGNLNFPNPDGNGQEKGHSGNGYAKITPLF